MKSLVVTGLAALSMAAGAGEVLYNGIRLPDEWPPRTDAFAVSNAPAKPFYLEPANIPDPIPADLGRQLFVEDTLNLMGEMAADLCCKKLGVNAPCRTAELPLPGGEKKDFIPSGASLGRKAAYNRQGSFASKIEGGEEVICECEQVTRGEIIYAVKELGVRTLKDLRRRTRVGMGTCQGSFCMKKAAQALADALGTPEKADELLEEYVTERWKGIIPVGWGDTLREAELMRRLYAK